LANPVEGKRVAIKCPKCHSENPETKQFCADCGTQLSPSKGIEVSVTRTLETTPDELARGSLFAGRYEIIEELGRGGMGRVFRAFDKKIEEEVALKLIRPEIAVEKRTVERFRNEIKIARKIRHANVCGMFDLGEEREKLFISMEYVRGEDLKSVIRRLGNLTVGKAVSIARQVAEGLAEAHKLGIIHRDLKPHNIMIDKEGNAKIMDFGIARTLAGEGTTAEGVIIGTPEYMSPEQVEGKPADQRSDIYSLGIILYEMLTGRVPFEGDTPFTVGVKHKSEAPKNPKLLNPSIPDDLSGTILKCLEKDPSKRYQSAGDVRAEFERVEKGLPTTERAEAELLTPTRKPFTSKEITVKFQPKKLIIPALAVVAVIAAAIIFWPKTVSNLDPKLVAVAVFENKTGDPKLDNIGSMAAERIMQGLTQVGQFSVSPMPSAETLSAAAKGKDKLRALAEATKAAKIVHGDYFLQGDKLQFHAWVQDMVARKNLITLEPASGPAADPAATLEPMRLKLMGGLAGIFNPWLNGYNLIVKTPPDIEAYREFAEGIKLYYRADYPKATEHLLRAVEHDPDFKLALMQAAWTYYWQGRYAETEALFQKVEKSRADLSVGERYYFDALVAYINGDNESHLRNARQLLSIQNVQGFNWHNAWAAWHFNFPQEAIDRLADYNPNDKEFLDWTKNYWNVLTQSHHMLGNFKRELKEARRGRKQFPELLSILSYECRALAALGRTKDLQKLFEESKALPPQSGSPGSIMLSTGRELRAHGYKEEATRILNQALQWFEARPEQEKTSAGNRYNKAITLYVLGKWDEAKALFEGLHSDVPDNIIYLGYIGAIAAQEGNKEEALKISKQLEENKKPYSHGTPSYWRARIAALLGDKEGAVNLLRQATKQGYYFPSIHPTEDFESLADYPPYVQLLKPKG
jgi:serine/threonine protein kinase/tetratricopeptide (TPR) repeat protein